MLLVAGLDATPGKAADVPEQSEVLSEAGAGPSATATVFLPLRNWHRRVSRGAVLMLGVSVLVLALLIVLAVTLLLGNLRQDVAERQREERTAAARLDYVQAQLASVVHDYATWDDAFVRLILAPDRAWAEANIGTNVWTSLGYPMSLLVDEAGRPRFGQLEGRFDAPAVAGALGDGAAQLIDLARRNRTRAAPAVVGVVLGQDGPLIAAAKAFVPDEAAGLVLPPGPPAVLLFATRLDEAMLQEMADDLGLDRLTLVGVDTRMEGRSSIALHGPDSQVVARLAWEPRQMGRQQLLWLIPTLGGVAAPIALLMVMAFGSLQFSRALKDSETRLHHFLEVSSDWLWETDAAGRIAWISPSYAATTGLDWTEQIGRRLDGIAQGGPVPDDWERLRDAFDRRRPFRDLRYAIRDRADRTWILQVSGRPVLRPDGQLLCYRGVGRDITREWRAAQRLRETEGQLGTLVQNLRGIVFCRGVAGDGPFGYNEHGVELLGAGEDTLALPRDGRSRLDLVAWQAAIHPDDLDLYRYREQRLIVDGQAYQMDLRFINPATGAERWAHRVSWAVDGVEPGRRHIYAYVIDVTEQRQREEALRTIKQQLRAQNEELRAARATAEAASQSKSQFLAAMSHEIRTPMTAVLGMADLLAAEDLPPLQRHYVATIRNSGSHLLSIINDILDFSRIESGRLELERIDLPLVDTLEQVRSLMMPQAMERGLHLELDVRVPADLVIQGDPTRLRQVLVNLVANALKFTASGHVRVGVEQRRLDDQDWLHFSVEDRGIGIPAARQAALFEPFTQADSSTARHYGGSGLGLAICKRLVGAMNGRIGVVSQPGEGSTFWFELPLTLGRSSAGAIRENAALGQVRPLRVLVVDDVAVNRELLVEMLGRQGHQVDQAENGAQAVGMVTRGGYDLVLMDVQMPVMDGMEATRRIRRLDGPAAGVPILALTANVMASERKHYLSTGMNRCLTKPVVWPELFAALAAVASGSLAPAGPTALPESLPAGMGEVALLDTVRLDAMAAGMSAETFERMLARGIAGAEAACARLRALVDDRDALAREAHRLRGTAGTFGLRRVAALAEAIEVLAMAGGDPGLLVDALAEACASSGKAAATWNDPAAAKADPAG
ncbi:MAG TPA: ATP-binding protein [Geminicoccus sp.]|uniref:ATP-binding protein n=1 Tax=Geminicoccus sp. TaxID=2024832 RepID=UPI002BEE656A|nr:ATP-binding protein [Geminicoccus sp.]HWL66844.1 ATP-binding protein [Geminicoccus sp.]